MDDSGTCGLCCPPRLKLDSERLGFNHRFAIHTKDGEKVFYLTCGIYPDGRLGELFIHAGKEGSLIAGALDGHAIGISIGLQHGVPLRLYVAKMRHTQFEPSGMVAGVPEAMLRDEGLSYFNARSPFDYIGAYLDWKFPDGLLRDADRRWIAPLPDEQEVEEAQEESSLQEPTTL